ncbi:MAG: cytochrome c5 family protein [Candidatus Dactylopiibacterium carminicum]|uniref:Cytochrome c5 family protein n=1 Tax=Candidatus Dactylopiibacterium carminicum TaxID=857335 RepID=A0A272ENA6_9RHOO|nr:c-type cytochrome [Candidatus Dactylopiibacterium carminicum]KAF7598018.1 cytochrome c5 family protein [Candidatus Dactylopiibacterium carminicum]PAS91582.1 MAG: cytochrome c5 family protein [Candidatus Dactylopiibacterium carminicum]PAS93286.1 MAG: cytochrome c5 family protein [Candidatus Dactylopiibacterium carminicum]PAS96332.1 MAG: hypothetical protein BSR46_15555 [Candidatus Dactylopiibacterium carminicum]
MLPMFSKKSSGLIVLCSLAALVACGKKALDEEKTAELIQPVARLALSDEVAAPGGRSGEQLVQTVCSACHGTGALGAPKAGDKAAWAPRIAQGIDALYKSAFEGKGQMPARAGAQLTDEELHAAVDQLVALAR